MNDSLEYTGERMVPQGADAVTFWEHVERYRFACARVRGKHVLDIACGEGYGSASMLKAGALSLHGVDVDPEAVAHARRRYNIDAKVGSAEAIPIESNSIDLVVSFETIEHVLHPEVFMDECVRVLRPDGCLIISTPNVEVYHGVSPNNPFHCSEMSIRQFDDLLARRFTSVEMFGQSIPAPWFHRTRGVGRLVRILDCFLDPARGLPLDESLRSKVVDLCSKPASFLQRYLTADAVQPVNASALNKSCYVVAVAKGVRKV